MGRRKARLPLSWLHRPEIRLWDVAGPLHPGGWDHHSFPYLPAVKTLFSLGHDSVLFIGGYVAISAFRAGLLPLFFITLAVVGVICATLKIASSK